jgi:hypothetical protein
MDKLSDFLPIIIFIALFVVSVSRGNKKKVVTHETTIPGRRPAENKPVIQKPRPAPAFSEKPEIQATVHTPIIPQASKIKPAPEQKEFVIETAEENSTPFLNLSDMDELKKALIYTEIFKTKNYDYPQ